MRDKVGLKNTVINEPTKGGPDLCSKTGDVVVQTRFLANTQSAITQEQVVTTLEVQPKDLSRQLKASLASSHVADLGYVVLTYLGREGNVTMIVRAESRTAPHPQRRDAIDRSMCPSPGLDEARRERAWGAAVNQCEPKNRKDSHIDGEEGHE